MQNGPSRQNALAAYGLLLVCVVVAWSACMAGGGIWPFGAATLGPIDNMQQQATDFGAISAILEGRESLFWSYPSGGAARIFLTPFAQNLVFPTTWLAWLMPWDDVLQALSWQLLFQLVLAALTCCWYLRRRFRATPWMLQTALAFSYAFSHFFLTKYLCLNFLNIYAIFPAYLAVLDDLLFRKRTVGFVVVMALMMAFAGYFAWMFGLFALVYALSQRNLRGLWHERGRLTLLVGASLLALAVSCALWLPTVVYMADSSRAGTVTTEHLLDYIAYPDDITFWTLTPLACACLCMSPAKRLRAILISREGLSAAVLCVCLLLPAATFVWCIGSPMCFMSRFSYMVGLMLCCMACRACVWGAFPRWGKRYIVLLGIMGALMVMGYRFLRFEPEIRSAALWGFACACILVPILCCAMRRHVAVLVVCMAGTVVAFLGFRASHEEYAKLFSELRMERVENDYRLLLLTQELPMSPGDRIKSVDLALMESNGEYAGVNRFSNNLQSATRGQKRTMNRLGYLNWWTRQMDIGGTAVSDAFLGFRYLATERPLPEGWAVCVHAEPGFHLYTNPYYWGVGALVSCADIRKLPEDASPMQHQQALYSLLAGQGAPAVFLGAGEKPDGVWRSILCGDEPKRFEMSLFPAVRILGGTSHANVILPLCENALPGEGFVVDFSVLAALSEKHRGRVEVIRQVADGLDLRIHPQAGQDMLLVPLLYHEGYHAYCCGRELEVVDAQGFTGVLLPEVLADGAEIRLRFIMPYTGAGTVVSLCGCLAGLLLFFARKRQWGNGGFSCNAGAVLLIGGYVFGAVVALWTLFWCAASVIQRL